MQGFGPKPKPNSDAEPEPEWAAELNHVEEWRLEELRRAGWGAFYAFRLAVDLNVDLHRACDLLKSGCDPDRAMDILT